MLGLLVVMSLAIHCSARAAGARYRDLLRAPLVALSVMLVAALQLVLGPMSEARLLMMLGVDALLWCLLFYLVYGLGPLRAGFSMLVVLFLGLAVTLLLQVASFCLERPTLPAV